MIDFPTSETHLIKPSNDTNSAFVTLNGKTLHSDGQTIFIRTGFFWLTSQPTTLAF